MKDFLKKFFDIKFWKFILVGAINTVVGMCVMYGMYFLGDTFNWYGEMAASFVDTAALNSAEAAKQILAMANTINFWVSSALNYTLTSILSYILNKNITFKSKGNTGRSLFRFIINIAVCYLISYGLARPLTSWVMTTYFPTVSDKMTEYITMFVGMVFFTACNYIGQRFFAFKPKKENAAELEK